MGGGSTNHPVNSRVVDHWLTALWSDPPGLPTQPWLRGWKVWVGRLELLGHGGRNDFGSGGPCPFPTVLPLCKQCVLEFMPADINCTTRPGFASSGRQGRPGLSDPLALMQLSPMLAPFCSDGENVTSARLSRWKRMELTSCPISFRWVEMITT